MLVWRTKSRIGKLFGDDYKGDPLGIVAENYPLSGQHGAVAHGER